MALQRIKLLGVPVDICHLEDLEKEVLELLATPGTKQIMFLSIWDLLKARGKNDYSECLNQASLILPISKSILFGASFLHLCTPVRYNPFRAIINILSILENHYKSLYLLGGYKKQLQVAEKNVRATYPRLQIVGRYVGNYPESVEKDIVQAIFKASPSLVLLSNGVKDKNIWAYRRRNQFSSSIFLYYRDTIGIFSKRIKRVSDETFDKGREIIPEILHNPFKIFLIFPFLWYNLLLVWYRIMHK